MSFFPSPAPGPPLPSLSRPLARTQKKPYLCGDMREKNVILDYRELKPHRLRRIVWCVVNATLFRVLARPQLRRVRNALLRLFGARVHPQAQVYESAKIFAPWQLTLGRCTIGPGVELYNKAPIAIGDDTVVSQRSFLCTASHDISSPMMALVTGPITLGDRVWVAAEAFIGPGVTLADGAVAGARAAVFKSVPEWTVVGGNPARQIGTRKLRDHD